MSEKIKQKKTKQKIKYEHIPVYPEIKTELDEIGRELAKNLNKKTVSYNKIEEYLISLHKSKVRSEGK